MIVTRPERPEDFPAIRDLIVTTFRETYGTGELEADLVERLRARADYDPSLALVALDGDRIIGHIFFSRVVIAAPGGDVREKDNAVGTLLSREFVIERAFIAFRIGGGRNDAGIAPNASVETNPPGGTGVHLLVDGKIVRSSTGHNANRMRNDFMDVGSLQGKTGRLLIVDRVTGGWGNIGIDEIVFTDEADRKSTRLNSSHRT